jgi:hypothetical protein
MMQLLYLRGSTGRTGRRPERIRPNDAAGCRPSRLLGLSRNLNRMISNSYEPPLTTTSSPPPKPWQYPAATF